MFGGKGDFILFNFKNFYLFNFRERGREEERERNIDVGEKHQLVVYCTCPHWEPIPQPRHVF